MLVKVVVPYPGAVISVNHFKDGWSHGRHTKAQARAWMQSLALAARAEANRIGVKIEPPVRIRLSGHFRDHRSVPDLHNLHKVIGDALQQAFWINDREFRFDDGEVRVGTKEPTLTIEVECLR